MTYYEEYDQEEYDQEKDYRQILLEYICNFNKKLELNPNDVDLLYKRANTMYEIENYAQAIEEYEKVLELDKNKVDCYYYIAHAKKELGDIEGHDKYMLKYNELQKNNLL